jgi:hypothetical protein
MKNTRTIALTIALASVAFATGCKNSQNTANSWNNKEFGTAGKQCTSQASYDSLEAGFTPMTAQSESSGNKFSTSNTPRQATSLHNWNNAGNSKPATLQASNVSATGSNHINPQAVEYTAGVLSTIRMSNVRVNQDGSLAGFTPFNQYDQSIQLPTSQDRIGSMWFNQYGQLAGWAKAAPDATTWFAYNGWNNSSTPTFTVQSQPNMPAYSSLTQQNTGSEQMTIISTVPTP